MLLRFFPLVLFGVVAAGALEASSDDSAAIAALDSLVVLPPRDWVSRRPQCLCLCQRYFRKT